MYFRVGTVVMAGRLEDNVVIFEKMITKLPDLCEWGRAARLATIRYNKVTECVFNKKDVKVIEEDEVLAYLV
jgi:hypothetical protein